jgi:NADH-quinone oxidoreductase subunit K
MVPITTLHYLVVAAALFVLGVIGVLTRRNVVIVLMSIELILNAVNLNLVAFSRMWGLHGQVFFNFCDYGRGGGSSRGIRHPHCVLPQ